MKNWFPIPNAGLTPYGVAVAAVAAVKDCTAAQTASSRTSLGKESS